MQEQQQGHSAVSNIHKLWELRVGIPARELGSSGGCTLHLKWLAQRLMHATRGEFGVS